MSKDVTVFTIRNILHDKIKFSIRIYDEDLAHYAREKDKSVGGVQKEDYSLDFLEQILYRSVKKSHEVKVKNDTKTALKVGRKLGGKQNQWEQPRAYDESEDAMPATEGGKKGKKGGKGKKGDGKGKGKGKAKGSPAADPGPQRPKLRPKAELDTFCPYFQMGNCKHKTDAECARKHQLLNKHEIEFIKEKFEKDKLVGGVQKENYSLDFLEQILYRSVKKSHEVKLNNDTKTALKTGRKLGGKQNQWDAGGGSEDAMPAKKVAKRARKAERERRVKAKEKVKSRAVRDLLLPIPSFKNPDLGPRPKWTRSVVTSTWDTASTKPMLNVPGNISS